MKRRKARPVTAFAKFIGKTTNNFAEYQGLLAALDYALSHGYPRLRVLTDSELMARQISGRYKVRSPDLKPLHDKAQAMIARLESFSIRHVYREQNREADRLANQAMDDAERGVVPHEPAPRPCRHTASRPCTTSFHDCPARNLCVFPRRSRMACSIRTRSFRCLTARKWNWKFAARNNQAHETLRAWMRSLGVRQLAAAFAPASLLAGNCARGGNPRAQARGEESGSKVPHSIIGSLQYAGREGFFHRQGPDPSQSVMNKSRWPAGRHVRLMPSVKVGSVNLALWYHRIDQRMNSREKRLYGTANGEVREAE